MAKPKTSMIRYEAILPIGLLVLLVGIYTQFFMDLHARKALEWSLSKAVGAEVDIRKFESSIHKGHVHISGIDVTDADRPTHNLVSLQHIVLSLSWDALLRGKVVINTAQITGIATQTKRKKPGKVYPKSTEPSMVATEFAKLTDNALSRVKDKNKGTLFGDALSILEGKGAPLTQLESQLESTKLLTEFAQTIQTTQDTWTGISADFTTPMSGLEKKVAGLQNISFKSVDDAQKWLKNANSIYTDVQAQIKKVEDTQAQFNKDMAVLNSSVGKIDKTIASDIKTLQNYIQFPKIPENQLSAYLFDTYLSRYMQHYETAKTWADTYLPPNLLHKKEQYTLKPIPRKNGVLYTYGKQNSYPLFWLKHAKITSVASAATPAIGDLSGEISHVSTDQTLTKQPLTCVLRGDFPGIHINDLHINLIIDRRGSSVQDLLDIQIGAYPIQQLTLLESTEMQLKLAEAYGRLRISAKRNQQHIDIALTQYFERVRFDVQAQNTLVQEISQAAFAHVTDTHIEASAKGPFNQLTFAINSPLGATLADGFATEIDKRIQAEKDRIQKEITQKLDAEMAKIKTTVAQFNDTYTRTLKEQEAALLKLQQDIQTLQRQAESQVNGWKKEAEAKIEQERKAAEALIERQKKEAEAKVEQEKKKVLDEAKKQLKLPF
jgi:uncharacterized protein (TIGR03545 family)